MVAPARSLTSPRPSRPARLGGAALTLAGRRSTRRSSLKASRAFPDAALLEEAGLTESPSEPSAAPEHLYEQLAQELAALTAKGALRPGDRLPSVRTLSEQRSVSVSTVLQAYLLLESRGVIEKRPQSGHYVRATRAAQAPEPRLPRCSTQPCRVTVSDLVARVYGAARDPNMLLLSGGYLGHSLMPVDRLNRSMAAVSRISGGAGLSYDPPPGLPALRRQIARRAAECGVALAADDVVTTFGTMEALHLCLRAVARSGDAIIVESPCYYGVLQLIESLGMRAIEVPAHAQSGIDLSLLDEALRQQQCVKACLLVPNFSNPAGALMPDEAKQELVQMLARRDIPLIEDDIYGDLRFEGARPRPARAFDKKGLVMLCSSFSKTLAAGYRVGYTAPGRFRDVVERLKFAQSISTATLPQMAIADFLENGGYERHLTRLRRALADQTARVSEAIVQHFPRGTRISRPRGGFFVWVEMPHGKSAVELFERGLKQGVAVAPGPIFAAKPRFATCVRISCALPWSEAMASGIATLGNIASEL
jgi:DNA-binding transcriptional MocR family regulator